MGTSPEIRTRHDVWKPDPNEFDPVDIIFNISKKYSSLDEFRRLSFDEMLNEFDINGTSSKKIFDIFLQKGMEHYIEDHPENEAYFKQLKERLIEFGNKAKSQGAPKKVVSTYPPFKKNASRPLTSLREWQDLRGEDEGKRLFAQNLGNNLLIELWDLITSEDGDDNKMRKFTKEMYEICYGRDRQFSYFGKRASIVINCLIAAKSQHEDVRANARKAIALLALLREVSEEITGANEFWPYLVDSKSFGDGLHE